MPTAMSVPGIPPLGYSILPYNAGMTVVMTYVHVCTEKQAAIYSSLLKSSDKIYIRKQSEMNPHDVRQVNDDGNGNDRLQYIHIPCVLTLGVFDQKQGGTTKGLLSIQPFGMISCLFTATSAGTKRMNVQLDLDLNLDHMIVDTERRMPSLRSHFTGTFSLEEAGLMKLKAKQDDNDNGQQMKEGNGDFLKGCLMKYCMLEEESCFVCKMI